MSLKQQPTSPNHSSQSPIFQEPGISLANLVSDPQPTSSPPRTTFPTSSSPPNPEPSALPSDSSILLTPSPSSSSSSDTASDSELSSDSSDSSYQPTSIPSRLRRTKRQTHHNSVPVLQEKKMIYKTAQKAKCKKTTPLMNPRSGRVRRRKWRLDREDWRLIKGAKRHEDGEKGRGKRRRKG